MPPDRKSEDVVFRCSYTILCEEEIMCEQKSERRCELYIEGHEVSNSEESRWAMRHTLLSSFRMSDFSMTSLSTVDHFVASQISAYICAALLLRFLAEYTRVARAPSSLSCSVR